MVADTRPTGPSCPDLPANHLGLHSRGEGAAVHPVLPGRGQLAWDSNPRALKPASGCHCCHLVPPSCAPTRPLSPWTPLPLVAGLCAALGHLHEFLQVETMRGDKATAQNAEIGGPRGRPGGLATHMSFVLGDWQGGPGPHPNSRPRAGYVASLSSCSPPVKRWEGSLRAGRGTSRGLLFWLTGHCRWSARTRPPSSLPS